MINLGEQVKDKLTDFKGTVIARAEYLYGCVWICVVPKELHENKPIEDAWFDEQRLEVIVKKERKAREPGFITRATRSYGGPMPNSPKRNFPKPHQ